MTERSRARSDAHARLNPVELLRGAGYVLAGLKLLRKYPELARYWVVPILLTGVALGLGGWLALRYHDDLLALLWQIPSGADWATGLLRGLYWGVRTVAFLGTLMAALFVAVVLSSALASPFNDALSEAIEEREVGRRGAPFSLGRFLGELWRGLRLELLKLGLFAAIMTPLTLFSWFVPGLGHALAGLFGGCFSAVYFALDYIDWPASRRGLGVRARLSLLSRRPWLMVGFGLAVWGCLFVPILNMAFMPVAVAGGTRLFLDLESELQG